MSGLYEPDFDPDAWDGWPGADDPTVLADESMDELIPCDLCYVYFSIVGSKGIVVELQQVQGVAQAKFCVHCAGLIAQAYREALSEAGVCEHGASEGDYCEECNRESKRARKEHGDQD